MFHLNAASTDRGYPPDRPHLDSEHPPSLLPITIKALIAPAEKTIPNEDQTASVNPKIPIFKPNSADPDQSPQRRLVWVHTVYKTPVHITQV